MKSYLDPIPELKDLVEFFKDNNFKFLIGWNEAIVFKQDQFLVAQVENKKPQTLAECWESIGKINESEHYMIDKITIEHCKHKYY